MNKYKASITREQFLFFEMRTTAKLLCTGMDDNKIIEKDEFDVYTLDGIKKIKIN